MIQRALVVTVPPHRLWEALTEADAMDGWFGARVDWDLVPGGRATFTDDDGSQRHGRIEEVAPTERLRYRWWPDGDEASTSEVTYTLEPAPHDGTRLTVTEEPVPGSAPLSASCDPTRSEPTDSVSTDWTPWDGRLLDVWARAGGRMTAGVAGA